jgi:DNA-binding transcriptional regulator YiaG
METRGTYDVDTSIREDCLQQAEYWVVPTGDEIRSALSMANWSGVEFARRIDTNDRNIRRWLQNEKTIPYAAWCILCAQANLGLIWK